MCATLAAHINVIKELLLAKADPMLKRKVSDGVLCTTSYKCTCHSIHYSDCNHVNIVPQLDLW